jgi:hypothetical protein
MHAADGSRAVAGPAAAKNRGVSGDDNDRIARIRERAYHLWERGTHGHEAEDWLAAEREIDAEAAAAPAPKPKTKAVNKAARTAPKPPKAAKPAKAAKQPKGKPKASE